jgi:large subunit ribosomal protein L9
MKVILLRDVARVGKKGTIAEVPDGYARNQLIPSKSAEAATPQNIKKAEQAMGDKVAKAAADEEAFAEVSAKIDGLGELVVTAASNEKGHLFKAVSAEDVAALLKTHDIDTDLFLISFKEPVKEVGEHPVVLSHAGQTHTITINVKAE